jgi:hypothetical protein
MRKKDALSPRPWVWSTLRHQPCVTALFLCPASCPLCPLFFLLLQETNLAIDAPFLYLADMFNKRYEEYISKVESGMY